MGKGGSSFKPPPVPSPAPIFTETSPEVKRKGEDTRRKMLARLGRAGTILTGLGGEQNTLGLIA